MTNKFLIFSAAALLVMSLLTSPALAGRGKARSAKSGCKPVSLIVRGALDSVGADSLLMNVEGANKHARSLVGTSATISVSGTTKIVRDDVEGALSDLQAGDALNVQIRACKGADLATTALVAKRVSAESPVSEEPAADPVVEPAP